MRSEEKEMVPYAFIFGIQLERKGTKYSKSLQ